MKFTPLISKIRMKMLLPNRPPWWSREASGWRPEGRKLLQLFHRHKHLQTPSWLFLIKLFTATTLNSTAHSRLSEIPSSVRNEYPILILIVQAGRVSAVWQTRKWHFPSFAHTVWHRSAETSSHWLQCKIAGSTTNGVS